MPTAEQHKQLLVELLVRAVGGESARWRRLIGTVFVFSRLTHPLCNWSVEPAGTPDEVAAINMALKLLRANHRHLRR